MYRRSTSCGLNRVGLHDARTLETPVMSDPPQYKDYAESHGMQHGGFRDFLKDHGEAKTAEEKATERAVAKSRAMAVAKRKVGAMKAAGTTLSGSILKEELKAQAARARALAHLEKNSCGPSQWELSGGAQSGRPATARGDNTLDVIAKRKAKEAKKADKADKEAQELKARIIAQQEAFRGARASAESTVGAGAGGSALPPFWKELSDPSSGKPYYWNEVTNETVWERPQGGQRGHGGEQKVESLPPGWRVVVHEGTGQKLYEHESTKERRWTAPTSENDGYDMLHSAATEKPSIKFSLGGALGGKRKKGTSSSSSRGSNDGGSSSTGTDSESKKKYKFNNKVDPLDFEGGTGGKLGGGPESAGKMADSTATGALYQQRPYPAPGTRHKNKN